MMHLQTDQEFQQNKIKKLNLKFNVKMFSSIIRGGKAFENKQNICEFKKLLFKRKKNHQISLSKILDSKKLFRKQQIFLIVLQHLNMAIHQTKLRKKV